MPEVQSEDQPRDQPEDQFSVSRSATGVATVTIKVRPFAGVESFEHKFAFGADLSILEHVFVTKEAVGESRQQVLAELRRRITTVASGTDKVGSPMRLVPERVDIVPAPEPEKPPPVSSRDIFPVPGPLADVLPLGGLPRGGVVSLAGGTGTTSLLFSLLAAAGESVWSALVGMPGVGLLAAAELGVDLSRLVTVPDPGPEIWQVVSILADGVDLVVVAPPKRATLSAGGRFRVLSGRLRQRGAAMLVVGRWPGADLVLSSTVTNWVGIDNGHGRLRDRELRVEVFGRGGATRGRSATLALRSSRTEVRVEQPVNSRMGAERPAVAIAGTG